jgi:hypothetical protein
VELTVGRHAADDGAGVDPIIEAALRRRPEFGTSGEPRHAPRLTRADGDGGPGEGGLGWPGDPSDGDGTGLGWPTDLVRGGATDGEQPALTLAEDQRPARRRGWRRLFGGSSADRSTAA